MPYAQVNGIRLYYELHGGGDPLVLIPGLAAGLWSWLKQLPALSRKFRVVAFDPRGVGRSGGREQPFTMRTLADDVAGLLGELKIERAHVLGASFGGFVAQEFALAHPQMTRSLVLCCTSFGGARHILPPPSVLEAFSSIQGLNSEERARKNLTLAFSPQYVEAHASEFEGVISGRLLNPISDFAFLQQLQAAATFDAAARVHRIKSPTLVITGDRDTVVLAENSRNLAAAIPRAKLSVVEGGSHMFFIERADEFNRAVAEFIEEVQPLRRGVET